MQTRLLVSLILILISFGWDGSVDAGLVVNEVILSASVAETYSNGSTDSDSFLDTFGNGTSFGNPANGVSALVSTVAISTVEAASTLSASPPVTIGTSSTGGTTLFGPNSFSFSPQLFVTLTADDNVVNQAATVSVQFELEADCGCDYQYRLVYDDGLSVAVDGDISTFSPATGEIVDGSSSTFSLLIEDFQGDGSQDLFHDETAIMWVWPVDASCVPEPTSLALIYIAMSIGCVHRRRR